MVIRPDDAGGHLDPLEVAEHAEGLLESERAASAEAHLSSCDRCRELAVSVAGVTTTLAAQPPEVPIPDGVAARIDAALADEAASRAAPSTRQSSTEGFWSRLRGRMPAIAAAAASVAVLGLIGYSIAGTGGGDDAQTTSDAGGDMAESDDSGGTAEAPLNAPADEEGEESADEDAEIESDDDSAGAQDDAAGADEGDGEQAETFGDDVPAREQDELTAELQDLLAGRSAEAEPGEQGEDGRPCGTVLAKEVGGELLGAASTDVVEPGSVLVAIDLGDPDTVAGWVVPTCNAGPDDAVFNFEAPRPPE